MQTTRFFVAVLFVAGACALEEPDVGEVEQHGDRFIDDEGDSCPGCGLNGFTEDGLNYTFGQYGRSALSDSGAWNWNTDNPQSLCAPGTNKGSSCNLRGEYSQWLRLGLTNKRVHILTEVVRIVARQGFAVRDTWGGGNTYYGTFGIAPGMLDGSNYQASEIVTGGLLALLNPVPGVRICLTTRHHPNHCVGAGTTAQESAMFGYLYRHSYYGISGGIDAEDPNANARYGTADTATANETFKYDENYCTYSGSGETRHATACWTRSFQKYANPVTVLMTPTERTRVYLGGDRHEPIGY